MLLKEKNNVHHDHSLLRSTISPLIKNKRGEFLHVIPPPNPRQSRLHRNRLEDIHRNINQQYD